MRLLPEETRFNPSVTLDAHTLLDINMSGIAETKIIDAFSKLGLDSEILDFLSKNNPNIIDFDSSKRMYKVEIDYVGEQEGGVWLGLDNLSSGEKAVVICIMADAAKTKITVCNDIGLLDLPHYKLIFERLHDSEYIDIIIPNSYLEDSIINLYESSKAG